MNRKWPDFKLFKTVMLAWDNTARRGVSGNIFHNFSMDFYERWLAKVIRRTIQRYPEEERLVFINAWNEWAEGTYLEPDQKCGLEYLEATKRAILAGRSWETIVSSLEKFGKDSNVDHKELLEGILNYLESKENVERPLKKTVGVIDPVTEAPKRRMSLFQLRHFFRIYRKFRDKVFPHGTRRREIAKSFKFRFLSR
jgi:hypothetical protein